MNRHTRACGTAQTHVRKGRTEQQNRARTQQTAVARRLAKEARPLVHLREGAVRGLSLTSPLLECVCLGLKGVCLADSVEPCAWVLIRCAYVAERTWTRALDAGFLVTHEETLGHIQHLPRCAGVVIAQVQSCSPDAETRTFTVKFEQVIVLRSPLTYAHTREGLLWSVVPAVFRQLTAQIKKSTFMRRPAQLSGQSDACLNS
ncbi:hypothetical protein T492DRAFT_112192 [Pavlovales sp. CCMP2436]|nr:hypothetical protein T492DRAFT_112192 [Pavlovales sp. CCMP2436]